MRIFVVLELGFAVQRKLLVYRIVHRSGGKLRFLFVFAEHTSDVVHTVGAVFNHDVRDGKAVGNLLGLIVSACDSADVEFDFLALLQGRGRNFDRAYAVCEVDCANACSGARTRIGFIAEIASRDTADGNYAVLSLRSDVDVDIAIAVEDIALVSA